MDRFLTFDLGTTNFKVGLFSEAGDVLGLARITPPIRHPQPQRWELDAEEFVLSLEQAVGRLRAAAGDAWEGISAISFATQANSFLLLDGEDRPLMPLILWPDQRAMELESVLREVSELPGFRNITGMPRFSHLLGLAKLLHLRRRQPDLVRRAKRFCYISDYLTLLLIGQHITEASVAGLSGACDIRRLEWWRPALDLLEVPADLLPPIGRAGMDLGPTRAEMARRLGVRETTRLILGCLDQYAGAIGTGTVKPGQVCETTGTVLAAVRCSDGLDDHLPPDVYQGPGFRPDRFFQMSFSSTSANLLEHYRNSLPGRPDYQALTELARAAESSDLVIEPYDDAGPIERSFRHVRPGEHETGQVVRAIMERVVRSLAAQVRSLAGGQVPVEIRSAGGAARNDYWLQMKSNELGTVFIAVAAEEPTSLGAAILAAAGTGHGTLEEIAGRWVRKRASFSPVAR